MPPFIVTLVREAGHCSIFFSKIRAKIWLHRFPPSLGGLESSRRLRPCNLNRSLTITLVRRSSSLLLSRCFPTALYKRISCPCIGFVVVRSSIFVLCEVQRFVAVSLSAGRVVRDVTVLENAKVYSRVVATLRSNLPTPWNWGFRNPADILYGNFSLCLLPCLVWTKIGSPCCLHLSRPDLGGITWIFCFWFFPGDWSCLR
jgi:hypothetical protein